MYPNYTGFPPIPPDGTYGYPAVDYSRDLRDSTARRAAPQQRPVYGVLAGMPARAPGPVQGYGYPMPAVAMPQYVPGYGPPMLQAQPQRPRNTSFSTVVNRDGPGGVAPPVMYTGFAPATTPARPRRASVDAVARTMGALQIGKSTSVSSSHSEDWVKDIPASSQLKKEAARDLLARTNVVRMGVEYASGRGSVAAFMYALKEILYQARSANASRSPSVQVVYETGAQHNLVHVLGPAFDPGQPRQRVMVEDKEVLFVAQGHLKASDKQSGLMLGFVAANDAPDHHANRWLKLLSSPEAGEVAAIGVGQPYDWKYGGGQSIQFCVNDLPYQQQLSGISGGYPIRIPDISGNVLCNELTQNADSQRLSLAHVFWRLHHAQIDVMPIYGLHHPQMTTAPGREDQLIRNLCGGIQYAQHNGLHSKPTILVVIGDYSKELRPFGADHIESSANPHEVVYAGAAGAPMAISALSGQKVMLLYAGKVEQRYFQQLFRLSTLPPVVEGANSANMCQNIPGKAYLHMSMDGTSFVDIPSEQRGMSRARKLSYGLQANDLATRMTLREQLGGFIVDSRRPGSSVSNYFKAVHNQVVEQNQVIDILYQICELREIAPRVKKPAFQWSRKSPGTKIDYELWSDGQAYYRDTRGNKRHFSLLDLSPSSPNDRQFAHRHYVRPDDLRVTDIEFFQPKFFSRGRPPNPLVYMEGGQDHDRFVFQLDEHANTLTLIEKNDKKVEPQIYRRDPSKDGVAADGRHAGAAVLRKPKS